MAVCEVLQTNSEKSSYLTVPDLSFMGPMCDNVDHVHVNMTKILSSSTSPKPNPLYLSFLDLFAMLIHRSLTCLVKYLELRTDYFTYPIKTLLHASLCSVIVSD